MDAPERLRQIRERLSRVLEPSRLEVVDDSHKHIGHAGAQGGGGHFSALIVSERFRGLNPLQRHRAVYDALGDMMHGEIHALSITARSPDEL